MIQNWGTCFCSRSERHLEVNWCQLKASSPPQPPDSYKTQLYARLNKGYLLSLSFIITMTAYSEKIEEFIEELASFMRVIHARPWIIHTSPGLLIQESHESSMLFTLKVATTILHAFLDEQIVCSFIIKFSVSEQGSSSCMESCCCGWKHTWESETIELSYNFLTMHYMAMRSYNIIPSTS